MLLDENLDQIVPFKSGSHGRGFVPWAFSIPGRKEPTA